MKLRAPEERDAPAVGALVAAHDAAAFGRSDRSLDELIAEWSASDFDLSRDTLVAEDGDGRLAGYAVVHRFGTFAHVDPANEGQGVGTALLDWCEQRQRELGWKQHSTSTAAANERARELLSARGYHLVRSVWRMALELDDPAPAPPPAGVTFRPVAADVDGPALHRLDQAAFAAVPGTEPIPAASFIEEHLKTNELAESLSPVAQSEGAMVGFALTQRRAEAAFVDILAVDPGEQRRGIGRALLLEVFAAARAAGLSRGELSVAGDNPRALSLYESVGMAPCAQLDVYGRPVAA